MSKTLKESKKAIWPTFSIQCGAFTLQSLGHTLKEAENMLSLQLPKFPRWQYDPFGTVKNFTTMVKIKFTNEEDAFDDNFLQKSKFSEVKHIAQLFFDHEDLEKVLQLQRKKARNGPIGPTVN